MGKASRPVALSFAVVVGVLVTGAILVAESVKSDSAALQVIQRGPVSLQYSNPWRSVPIINSLPYGLELSNSGQLRKANASLWLGAIVAGAPIPGGLPRDFASNVHGVPSKQQIALHGIPVMRYLGVVDPGARRFALFVVATETHDFALLCTGANWSNANQCEEVMRTATLDTANVIPPGADASLAQQLERLIGPLNEQADLVSGLATAGSASGVAQRARLLHRLYQRAGQSLAGLQPRQGDRRVVVGLANALVAAAAGLDDLAESADARRVGTYEAAAVSVEASSRAVLKHLRRLRRIGFTTVPLVPPLSVPPMSTVDSIAPIPEELVNSHGESLEEGPALEAEQRDEWGNGEWAAEEAEDVGPGPGGERKTEAAAPLETEGAR